MNIRNAVQDKDPKNRDFYEKNFSQTLKVLETYKEKLKSVDNQLSNYEFIIVEDELNYFVKYNNLKMVDVGLGENNIITLNSSQRENLQQKSNRGNLIVLYSDDSVVKNNEVLLKKYNIPAVKLEIYNGDFSYEETLDHNISQLESIYKPQ
jgi:ABC-type Zn uptake system ZnuABC Zn-binding protein ZnuA